MKFLPSKLIPTSLLAGVASVALAGTVAAHTLTLQLPDGTTERIDYSGDIAPQVSFDASPAARSPFALMRQIAAQMDREADAMMRQIQDVALQPLPGPGQPIAIDVGNLPPGIQSYSFVSTLSPHGVCSQSTEIIAKGPGQKPQVITHRSGNCGALAQGKAPTNAAAPAAQPLPRPAATYRAKAADHPDYRSMFREASW